MRVVIEIETDGAAFEDAPATEIGRILRDAAARIEDGDLPEQLALRDINGNRVGSARWED